MELQQARVRSRTGVVKDVKSGMVLVEFDDVKKSQWVYEKFIELIEDNKS